MVTMPTAVFLAMLAGYLASPLIAKPVRVAEAGIVHVAKGTAHGSVWVAKKVGKGAVHVATLGIR